MKKHLFVAGATLLALGLYTAPEAMAGAEGKCKACHDFGTANKVGPGLKGIFGKKAGTVPGFNYSDSLANAGWVWDEEHLRQWIKDSPKAIKDFTGDAGAKTKMSKQNVKGAKADEVIEFLKGLK